MSNSAETIAFHQGKYRPLAECQINIASHALQYATLIFGGIRVYFNSETKTSNIFRLPAHVKRMLQSAHLMFMKSPYSEQQLKAILIELVKKNPLNENLYIRPFIYKYEPQLSPRLHNLRDTFSAYVIRLNDYLETNKGLNVGITSWQRVDENSIPARAKCSAAYLNSSLAKSEAMLLGFDEAIFLDSHGYVSEGSAENIFIVRNGELITPPLTASVLEGITRASILQMCQELTIPIKERNIARTELYLADEIFLCGTGAQIAWVKMVDHRQVGDGTIGNITSQLKDKFMNIVYGKDSKYQHWLTQC